jgi:hypothetical protein
MLRGHPRLTDVTGVVHFREKTYVAPLAGGGECAISARALRLVGGGPYALLDIFPVGVGVAKPRAGSTRRKLSIRN